MPITLTVEDGSGDPDANTYNSLEYLNTYHANRGNTYWGLVGVEDRKACAIRCTDYIDKRFGDQFRGTRMQKDQALAFPRLSAFDADGFSIDGVPEKLKKAHAEYALRAAIYNVLAPDPTRVTPGQNMADTSAPNGSAEAVVVGSIRSRSQQVGPIKESVTYEGLSQIAESERVGSRETQSNIVNSIFIPQYPEADLWIEQLIVSGGTTQMERGA